MNTRPDAPHETPLRSALPVLSSSCFFDHTPLISSHLISSHVMKRKAHVWDVKLVPRTITLLKPLPALAKLISTVSNHSPDDFVLSIQILFFREGSSFCSFVGELSSVGAGSLLVMYEGRAVLISLYPVVLDSPTSGIHGDFEAS